MPTECQKHKITEEPTLKIFHILTFLSECLTYKIMTDAFFRNVLLIILVSSLLPFIPASPALADNINEGVFSLDSKPYGMSYEDWTIKLWHWLLSMPSDINPSLDPTGERCAQGQDINSTVFFLIGSGGSTAERTCTIPAGKAIFIPINAVECSFLEFPAAKTDQDLHKCAEEDQSSNPGLYLSVDGREFKELEKYRVHSRAFNITFSDNNIFGVSGPTRTVSDGYWVMLEPLEPGNHVIHFKASLTNPTTGILYFSEDTKYNLNVK
jgi:hypothetical protein